MIDWSKITKAEFDLIFLICQRYEREIVCEKMSGDDWRILLMDMQACHISCPLYLEEMLDMPIADFGHDIGGIRRYMNRETGQLGNCFTPRAAVQ